MGTSKNAMVLSLCFICIIIILLYSKSKGRSKSQSIPLLKEKQTSSSSLSPTACLQSHGSNILQKSPFHPSMVQNNAPVSLNSWVENKTGFEIGGPSQYTWGYFGVYDLANRIDVTNFATNTLWESGLSDNSNFMWKNQSKGKQYIRDAVDLKGLPNEFYDFVCASDALEHIANPFKALLEWLRIMKPGGVLLIIAPFKNVTFDHKRDVDKLEHLINDYVNQTNEADLSHLEKILLLHDLSKDPPAGSLETFKARSEKNFENRALHQHVYDQELLYQVFMCLNLNVKLQFTWNTHQLIIGQKL